MINRLTQLAKEQLALDKRELAFKLASEEKPVKVANIVLGSFVNKQNATTLSKSLNSKGFKDVQISQSNNKYRVYIIEENTQSEITKKLMAVREKYSDAWVVYR